MDDKKVKVVCDICGEEFERLEEDVDNNICEDCSQYQLPLIDLSSEDDESKIPPTVFEELCNGKDEDDE